MTQKDTFVLTFGRFNPPTKGHEVVFDSIETVGRKYNTKNLGIFTSQSAQDAKNPLSYRDKVRFIRKAHPNVRVYENREIKTLFDAVGWVLDQNYSTVVVVLGSDRIPEFKQPIMKFVQKNFSGKKVIFEQAGATRSAGSKGVAGVSGTKVRKSVKDNDYTQFASMISDSMNSVQKKQLFKMLRQKAKSLKEEVALAIDIPNTFSSMKIYKNPGMSDLLKEKLEYSRYRRGVEDDKYRIRGFFNKNEMYCWSGGNFTHEMALTHLKRKSSEFIVFFSMTIDSSKTISEINSFGFVPGWGTFSNINKSFEPSARIFRDHANKLGWKMKSTQKIQLIMKEENEIILPQKSHITIHQLDNTTFDAKIDTGNNSYCAIHAENIRVSGNKKMVTFTTNGKSYTTPIVEFVTIASSMGQQQNRVVVAFDVHFANQHYTDVRFSLTDRSKKEYPILLGTQFLSQTNVLVKPIAESYFKTVNIPGQDTILEKNTLDFYINPDKNELAKLYSIFYKELKEEYRKRKLTISPIVSMRCIIYPDGKVFCWNAYYLSHSGVAPTHINAIAGSYFGDVTLDKNGTITRISTWNSRPSRGHWNLSDLSALATGYKLFKTVQAKLGWETAGEAEKDLNSIQKRVAIIMDDYQSLESTIKEKLFEAKVYNDIGFDVFDSVDRMSSNNWFNYGNNMLEARWLYLPKAKKHIFWASGSRIHAEILAKIHREYPDEFNNDPIVYAGFATRHVLNKKAIILSIDHAYGISKTDGRIVAKYPPVLSENGLAKVMKSAFSSPPSNLYVRKTIDGRSSGGGRGFTEEYLEVGFSDQVRKIVLNQYKVV